MRNLKNDKSFLWRARFLIGVIIILFLHLIYCLVNIAFVEGKNYDIVVLRQRADSKNVSSRFSENKRGSILDANGIPLAESHLIYTIIYDPKLILSLRETESKKTDKLINLPEEINSFLYQKLDIEEGKLEKLLEEKKESHYEKILINAEFSECDEVIQAIDARKIPAGVTYIKDYTRNYPYDELACDIIGFVRGDNIGLWGLEKHYDDYLKGKKGRNFGLVDENDDFVISKIEEKDGYNLVLNINYMVQKYVTEAMDRYAKENNPMAMEVVVMDPRDARVLAMASYPNYNLNNPNDLSGFFSEEDLDKIRNGIKRKDDFDRITKFEFFTKRDESILKKGCKDDEQYAEIIQHFRDNLWKNGSIVNTYEPGSTFKSFTLAMALEEGKIDKSNTYMCKGAKVPFEGEKPIRCHKRSGHGLIDYSDALAGSCNVAFMEIGEAIGRDIFYEYTRDFGFGSITNIDLDGEVSARGLLNPLNKLNPVELQTNAFGQGFNITPIQLITAYSALINGGFFYEPHVVNRVVDEKGTVILKNDKKLQRVILSKEVADEIKYELGKVVESGTGSRAAIEGYSIAGKTGTAEKGKREEKDYILSFIGFSPIENPEVIALVVVDDPDKEDVSSGEAIKVFKDMMKDVLPYLRVTKDYSNIEKK